MVIIDQGGSRCRNIIPVEKSDVVVSVALNVAGVRCYILRFYLILLVICFVVLAYCGSVVVYMVDLTFYI